MAVKQTPQIDRNDGKRYRVMHHIGGFTPTEDELIHDHIQGGIEHLNVITLDKIPENINLSRLVRLGAIREATQAEIEEYDKGNHGVQDTIREDEPDAEKFPSNPIGKDDVTGKVNPLVMSRAEMSMFNKADLITAAQEHKIIGYSAMSKDELLDALAELKA
jgi:hypothetical protein